MRKKLKPCPECGLYFEGRSKYCSYECAYPAMKEAVDQILSKEGPIYEKWKARLKASMGNL